MLARIRSKLLTCSIAGAALILGAGTAQAQLTDASIFKNLVYTQSGPNGSNVAYSSSFFNAIANEANPGDFTAASLTLPDTSTQSLPIAGPTTFGIGPSFATTAAMDAAYPMGSYTITATGATNQSATLTYDRDAYAGNIGRLDAASYNGLQGLSTLGGSFAVNFNAQLPASLTSAYTFFTVFGTDQGCQFLATSTTSCAIDPSHLLPGTTYTYELDFSNRIENTVEGVLQGVDFDVRTDGTFTTARVTAAVPEPATWALMILGFGMVGMAGRRKARPVPAG